MLGFEVNMRQRAVVFVLVVLVGLSAVAQERRLITEKDLYRFVWLADPQISPDGSRVAFTQVTVNEKKDGYDTSIWMVATAGGVPYRVTMGTRDSSPRWSPDGTQLAFLRSTEKAGKPEPPQIYVLRMSGGEAFALTSMPKGASGPQWSPNGRMILFTSTSTPEDIAKAEKQRSAAKAAGVAEPPPPEETEGDVRVITRAIYRFNGTGYLDPKRPAHIWTVSVPATSTEKPRPEQLTKGDFEEEDPTWSPDSKLIYFTSTRIAEPYYDPARSTIYSIPATGGEITKVFEMDGDIGQFALSPDGKRIAFRGSVSKPVLSYNQPDLWVVDAGGGQAKNLTEKLDADMGGGLAGDQRPPRGGRNARPLWTPDGRSIIDSVEEQGRVNLRRIDAATGQATHITQGDQEVFSWTASRDGNKFVIEISTPTEIGDLYILNNGLAGGQTRRLTNVNEKLWREIRLTPPEEFWYQSFDGKRIHAWVQKPPDHQEGRKYPLILNIHGGPHAAYGYTFMHEFQWMAAKGYIVLYPNPRGSSSYGQEFGNIIQYRYPGDDHKDLMIGVDETIKRGWADPDKLGVTGGSGGGVLTNWAVGQTDRFKAAVSQRSIADWEDFWYTADFTLFTPFWFRGAPWEQKEDFAARSPLTYVKSVKTPLMLIEGEADYRTPPSAGGEQMFRALKFLRKPVVMVRFPDESHELSRSGKPNHRIERLFHIVNWFDIYLQGAKNIYDVPDVTPVPPKERQQEPPPGETPKKDQ